MLLFHSYGIAQSVEVKNKGIIHLKILQISREPEPRLCPSCSMLTSSRFSLWKPLLGPLPPPLFLFISKPLHS